MRNLAANRNLSLLLGAFGFAIAGMLTRLHIQSIESRFQIAFFWAAALALELILRPSSAARPSRVSVFVNGTVATLAIIAMKLSIEGLPHLLR